MSFPRLVLSGSVANRSISDISVVYDNDTTTVKPAQLTRSKYDVQRKTQLLNVSGGTAPRYQDIPYNAFRFIHTWIGYIDVITGSVSVFSGSTAATTLNVNLIKNAAILTNANGIEYTLPAQSSVGPDDPSLDVTYEDAYEKGHGTKQEWVYKVESDGETPPVYTFSETPFWFIRDINIIDNNNGTSRVTFHFEMVEDWQDIAAIVDANTP